MLRKILSIFSVLLMLPVSAGQLEQAIQKNENVFLYLYKQDCGLCQMFNPVYNKLQKKYNDKFAFLKIDAETSYGRQLVLVYNVQYVPFVVNIHSKNKNAIQIMPRCLVNDQCADKAVKSFLDKYGK